MGGWGWGGCQHRWVGMGWTSTWVGGGGVEVGWTSTLNTTCEIVVLATPLQNIETAAYHAYEHSTVIAVSLRRNICRCCNFPRCGIPEPTTNEGCHFSQDFSVCRPLLGVTVNNLLFSTFKHLQTQCVQVHGMV